MTEFFNFAFAPANLFYSLLLCIILIYWMTVFLGALDLDFLDFDIDTDVDMDVDVDVDVDIDADVDVDSEVETDVSGGGGGLFLSALSFFNIGMVPFMIFVSVLVLSMWAIAIFFNNTIQNTTNFGLWIAPIFISGLFVSKIFTAPFKAMHKRMTKTAVSKKQLVGKIAKVTLSISNGKAGQAELNYEDSHFLLTVRSEDESESIPKGSQVILTEYRDDRDYFLVTRFEV